MKSYNTKEKVCGFTIPNSELLTPLQAAETLHCKDSHIYKMISTSVIPYKQTGYRYLIPRAELINFITERTSGRLPENKTESLIAPFDLFPLESILTVREIATFMRCSLDLIYSHIDDGHIMATNIAASSSRSYYRIAGRSLAAFIYSRREGIYVK